MSPTQRDQILRDYLKSHPNTSRRKLQIQFPWIKNHLFKYYKNSLKVWYQQNGLKLPDSQHFVKNAGDVLSKIEVKILRFLLEQRLAITPQINFFLETGEKISTTYNRLYKLLKFGYVSFVDGYKYHLWDVSADGKKKLLEYLADDPYQHFLKNISSGSDDIDHDLLVNDVRLTLTNYFGGRFVRWYSDALLRKFDIYHGDEKLSGLSKVESKSTGITKFHYPDGCIEYYDMKSIKRFAFIELERTHKNVADYTRLFEQNISDYYQIVIPETECKEMLWDARKLAPVDQYFYILGPHSRALPMMIKARHNATRRILEANNWYYNMNPRNLMESADALAVAHEYQQMIAEQCPQKYFELDTHDDYVDVLSKLPYAVIRDDFNISKIDFFVWGDVRRPRNEARLYRECEAYRDMVDRYDPVESFKNVFEMPHFDWIEKYRKPKRRRHD